MANSTTGSHEQGRVISAIFSQDRWECELVQSGQQKIQREEKNQAACFDTQLLSD
jgi:hypothetical protein